MKTEFEIADRRIIPGRQVTYNGSPGRFWEKRQLTKGAWVFCERRFAPLRATKKDLIELFCLKPNPGRKVTDFSPEELTAAILKEAASRGIK